MHAPYTDHPADAYQAAQIATAALLTLVGYRPLAPRSRTLFVAWSAATWIAALAPTLAGAWVAFGAQPHALLDVLAISTGCLLLAFVLSWRLRVVLFGLPLCVGLSVAGYYLTDFDTELCAAQMMLVGVGLGLLIPPQRTLQRLESVPLPRTWHARAELAQDVFFVVVGSVAAAMVSHFVLFRVGDGSDETAYTYQAAVFAKGQLYGKTPICLDALRNFWVFWRDERMFAQYQPGWPLFLVPFVWLKAIWLGGPVSFGLLCMAIARLARRAVRRLPSMSPGAPLSAGFVAGAATLLSNTMLVNGGSRFPHVFGAALFCFTLETTWVLGRTKPRRAAAGLGLLLGTFAGWLAVVRAPDAVLLSVGPLLYLLIAVVRRKSSWVGLPCAVLATLPWAGFLLYSAHVQVGGWGKMPYQLINDFYPWAEVRFSLPAAHHWKWALPLGTGAYCWWPLSPALGAAGLVLATRLHGTRALPFTLVLSGLATLAFYGLLELGRGGDFGYGPRYTMVLIVPMAIGTALLVEVALRPLTARVRTAVRIATAIVGAVTFCVIGADMFPSTYRLLKSVSAVERAASAARLNHAIVLVPPGVSPYGPTDITRNVPIELYDQPVIYANESDTACLRREYPGRTIYRASGKDPVRLKVVPAE